MTKGLSMYHVTMTIDIHVYATISGSYMYHITMTTGPSMYCVTMTRLSMHCYHDNRAIHALLLWQEGIYALCYHGKVIHALYYHDNRSIHTLCYPGNRVFYVVLPWQQVHPCISTTRSICKCSWKPSHTCINMYFFYIKPGFAIYIGAAPIISLHYKQIWGLVPYWKLHNEQVLPGAGSSMSPV